MNEKLLEKKLREEVKKLGGLALKFASASYTGMPDRIVLMKGGNVHFVELKSTGRKQTDRQLVVSKMLMKYGFEVTIIDSQDGLNNFLNSLKCQ